jgi:hypothetical protein
MNFESAVKYMSICPAITVVFVLMAPYFGWSLSRHSAAFSGFSHCL